jgi:hypothetical protein
LPELVAEGSRRVKASRVTIGGANGVNYCERHRAGLTRYARSLRLLTDCDHYVVSDGMPQWLKEELRASGAEIIEAPSRGDHPDYPGPDFSEEQFRIRLAFVELTDYDTYIQTCCKATYFQTDIPHMAGLHVACEGMTYGQCRWNTDTARAFDSEWAAGIAGLDVVNGGTQVGDRESFLRYARNDLDLVPLFRARRTTQQPAFNWAVHTGRLPCTMHHPDKDDFCLTGQAIALGVRKAWDTNGTFVNPYGQPYRIVHQRDRFQ